MNDRMSECSSVIQKINKILEFVQKVDRKVIQFFKTYSLTK